MLNSLQTNFNDANSFMANIMADFHDASLLLMLAIIVFIWEVMSQMLNKGFISKSLTSHHTLEMVWTLLPMLIVGGMAVPSLMALYFIDSSPEHQMSPASGILAITGNQWFWEYSQAPQGDTTAANFPYAFSRSGGSMYMVQTGNLTKDGFRLLDTTASLTLPGGVTSRILVTSADVLHSWAVPALGVKLDACPGRANVAHLGHHSPGMYFGQCSEICGSNHSFMPIMVFCGKIDS